MTAKRLQEVKHSKNKTAQPSHSENHNLHYCISHPHKNQALPKSEVHFSDDMVNNVVNVSVHAGDHGMESAPYLASHDHRGHLELHAERSEVHDELSIHPSHCLSHSHHHSLVIGTA